MAKRSIKQPKEIKYEDSKLIGGSEHIAKLEKEISYVAEKIKKYDFSVLIEGPSGTGKELIAREISIRSGRGEKFIPINCAAISEHLFESELFGHEKGAFTGAYRNKQGLIKKAEGGILFLDEIGDLDRNNQGKILRLLQEKTFYRVGSEKEETITDIRIIAATNKELEKETSAKKFREDLYYRLNHRIIQTLPLKERLIDTICLLHHYVKQRGLTIDPKVKALLYSYDFPGNVRELESLLYSADDYNYIKNILADRMANLIGMSGPTMLIDSDQSYFELSKEYEKILNDREKAQKKSELYAVSDFFDAINKFDQDDRDWGQRTKLYEILMLWGNPDYSIEKICRTLKMKNGSLNPSDLKRRYGFELPPRPIFIAEMEEMKNRFDLALTFYPDFWTFKSGKLFNLPQYTN